MTPPTPHFQPPRKTPAAPGQRRRGAAVLLVLGLLALTLALAYAMVRSQASRAQMQGNLQRRAAARAAAQAGLEAALRRMHDPDWPGVDVPFRSTLQEGVSFEAAYETGDRSLLESDPEFREWPYRVTITVTGKAIDPMRPGAPATCRRQCVVRLRPRAMSAPPASWTSAMRYTVYQWSASETRIELPTRIAGPVYLQSRLQLCSRYPAGASVRERYLRDLAAMRKSGLADDRPFEGPVSLPYILQWSNPSFAWLQSALETPTRNINWAPGAPVSPPSSVVGYRLYPGGRWYEAPDLSAQHGAVVAHISLAPEPQTNPLGVFRASQSISLGDNTALQGVLLVSGDAEIRGRNIHLSSIPLPPVEGGSQTVELPVIIGADDVRVRSGASAVLTGGVVAGDDFEVERGSTDTRFTMKGRLTTGELILDGRQEWELSSGEWSDLANSFELQKNSKSPPPVAFFPQWALQKKGVGHSPLFRMEPPAAETVIHWQDWSRPVFLPAPGDEGLCWEVVRWQGD